MHKADMYSIHVLTRDEDNNPLQISVNGKIYESFDSGLFITPLSDVENLKLAVLDELGISLMVANRVKEGYREIVGIQYSILHTEVRYCSEHAYAWIFHFKPRKYLRIRLGGKIVSPMDVLEAYFYALGMAEKLDHRVKPVNKSHWHFDSEIAEAHLEIALSRDMTIKQAVYEVKEIFKKIDECAVNILGEIVNKKIKEKRRV